MNPDQVHLQQLPTLLRNLHSALQARFSSAELARQTLRQSVSAQCCQCEIQLQGPDLVALSEAPGNPSPSDRRLSRIREGYCARDECPSYYYRLIFHPIEGFDWSPTLDRLEAAPELPDDEAQAEPTSPRAGSLSAFRPLILRGAVVVAVLLAALLVRHWRNGGSIPLLREPEKFMVDPTSLPAPPG